VKVEAVIAETSGTELISLERKNVILERKKSSVNEKEEKASQESGRNLEGYQ